MEEADLPREHVPPEKSFSGGIPLAVFSGEARLGFHDWQGDPLFGKIVSRNTCRETLVSPVKTMIA